MDINVHVYFYDTSLTERVDQIMATIEQIAASVATQTTQLESLNTFVEGLHQQIKDLKLSQPDQAKIDALFASVSANDKAIADAFTANTPQAGGTPINPV